MYWRKLFSSSQLTIHDVAEAYAMVPWHLCVMDTLRPLISVLNIKVS